MTHMVCGYPSIAESQDIFHTLYRYSAYIEVQFPFSDPIGDGPIIEKANNVSIDEGMTTEKCFEFLQNVVEEKFGAKILIMTYYNIVFNYGVESFIKKAKKLGVYGFIVPDIPFDEEAGKDFRELCRENSLVCTELVTPSMPDDRLQKISELQPELVYAISQNMTTGSIAQFGMKFEEYMRRLKQYLGCDIGVGFGVKSKMDVEKVCKNADFAIIGSEFIKRYNSGAIQELNNYLDEITQN